MADRQDIDALLIGALYGELDGDERARLETHLASHPQDRSALEGLRSTRELLREADLPVTMAVAEPSPAITAMLLQEAARRAPAPASRGGFLAFLAGLLKPFAASPALSAAAALVLVGGAAGLLYSRGALRTSEPTVADHTAAKYDTLETGAAGSGSAAAAAPAPNLPAPGANVDDYRVALADGENAATAVAGVDRGQNRATEEAEETQNEAERESLRKNTGEVAGGDALAAKGKRSAGAGGGGSLGAGFETTTQRPGYIAVDKQSKDEPSVLALDGTRYESATATGAAPTDEDQVLADRSGGQAEKKAPARVALAEGRGAAAAPDPAPPPPPAPTASAAVAPQKPGTGKAGTGSGSATQKLAQQQPPATARDAGKAGAKAYDPVKTAELDAWARGQHARMVKLVNAGKCTEAGPIGAEIARKNPEYYQSNVANDRAVRACRGYVDRARRAKAEDAKTKAAAPRNNAPDSPYQADMESSK
jgi:anti-sigma factor RsiW